MGIFSTSKDDTTKAQRNFKPRTPKERERLATLAGSGDTAALRKATTTSKTKTRTVKVQKSGEALRKPSGRRTSGKGKDSHSGTVSNVRMVRETGGGKDRGFVPAKLELGKGVTFKKGRGKGGEDSFTKQVSTTTTKFDSMSFDQAISDFKGRGGSEATVEAQPKAAGGGSGAAVGSFQAGAITAQGITAQEFGVDANTPVNSKQRGR